MPWRTCSIWAKTRAFVESSRDPAPAPSQNWGTLAPAGRDVTRSSGVSSRRSLWSLPYGLTSSGGFPTWLSNGTK